MGYYYSTTFPAGLLVLVVLVLVLVTNGGYTIGSGSATAPGYCGSTKAKHHHKFSGYVHQALKEVVEALVSEKDFGVSVTYPSHTKGSATATAFCWLTDIDGCNDCLHKLLPKVIYILLMNDKSGADYTYPILAENGASSAASCELNDMNKCNKCLNKLLPYVNQCSSYISGFASLVLVLLVISSTTFPAASDKPKYCGTTQAEDPDFPGYVVHALDLVIEQLLSNDDLEVAVSYPDPAGGTTKDWAYALASCYFDDTEDCRECLGYLVPYMRGCSAYTRGAASFPNMCSLGFVLKEWKA
ncbi:hypothetical protein LINGRAHAP2_LOCUS29802 [Linum grandiflorum]